jgi:hypothetical protein
METDGSGNTEFGKGTPIKGISGGSLKIVVASEGIRTEENSREVSFEKHRRAGIR